MLATFTSPARRRVSGWSWRLNGGYRWEKFTDTGPGALLMVVVGYLAYMAALVAFVFVIATVVFGFNLAVGKDATPPWEWVTQSGDDTHAEDCAGAAPITLGVNEGGC